MLKIFTPAVILSLLIVISQTTGAQSIITQWNFNSVVNDGATGTGTTSPFTGTGSLTNIGGTNASFASGATNSGSSDINTTDNTAWGVTSFPAQGTNDKTAGIQFSLSTVDHQNIIVTFDQRHSGTSPRHLQFQYTLDISAAIPVWVDFAVDSATAGDAWFARSYNLSAITGLSENANAGFRVVSTFRPATTEYAASNPSGTYAPGGNWRFDMVTVKGTFLGTDVTPPVAQSFRITSATASFIRFDEAVTPASATNTANYVFNPAVVINSATLAPSGDTVFLNHVALTDGQLYSITVSGVQDLALNTMVPVTFNTLFNGSLPNLIITEIIYSPDEIEMIEVYNAGATSINLGGLKWTDGTTGNFPEASLAPGATAVFARSPSTASIILNVSPVYTILNGLGNTTDILVIRNSLNQVVDSVSYFTNATNGWPVAPAGIYGYSFELNAAANDNNVGSNWSVPQNQVVPKPAQGVIRATPGVYPAPAIANVNFVVSKVSVNETTTVAYIIANLQGGGSSPTSIDVEVLPFATATSGSDFTLPASLQYNWVAGANNVSDTIIVTIINDALPENAEYFVVRFVNGVNVSLPPAAANSFTLAITDEDRQAPPATGSIQLNPIASFSNSIGRPNSAEIVAHDPASQRLFIANSVGRKLDIVNFSNPSAVTFVDSISVSTYGNINSVAVKNGIVAAAIENTTPELPGKVVFFDINGVFVSQVEVGAMPDMILFNEGGTKVFTANEGQPNDAYTVDPEGSVSIIDISGGVAGITQTAVTTAGFTSFNTQIASLRAAGVRIFGVNATVAQDMEPEYITISPDGLTAYVTCQENNAIAVIDIATSTVTEIRPLGKKDYTVPQNGFDASDRGGVVEIANWPVKGLYMPDAIASYSVGGQTFLVTANEGDAREYSGFRESLQLGTSTYVLDSATFPNRAALKLETNLGRLTVTNASGDTDGDGDFDEIHAFGARSFSIWNATTGALVWDSGDDLELITSKHPVFGPLFNATNSGRVGDPNSLPKNRSDDKGPEPEGVTIAQIFGRTFAFVALERIGGCIVYDITDPANPVYVDYKNTRTVATYGGDNGPEGIIYISAANSPTGVPIVILANEISSTLSFYAVNTTVLDITLAGIKAQNNGNRNSVSWTTAGEDQGDVFEIEKSKNGTAFDFVKTIPANGSPSSYTFIDEQPYAGITYYRLKLKHTSGSITYSPVVSASMKGGQRLIQVYPNPVKNKMTVNTGTQEWINKFIEIVDRSGVVIKRVRLTAQQTIVDVQGLASGIYLVNYSDGKLLQSIKITKE